MSPERGPHVIDLTHREAEPRDWEAAHSTSGRAPRGEWSMQELVQALRRFRRIILGGAVAGLALAGAYLALATPVYTSTALVQIEDRTRSPAGLDELTGAVAEKTAADAEIEVLRSRTLLGSVVDQLQLDVSVRPRLFPVVGAAVARRYHGPAPAPAPFHLDRFAWGGERIALTRLDVAEGLQGEPLTLTALGEGRYEVRDGDGALQLQGRTGVAARSADGAVQMFVSELAARPATEFIVTKLRRSAAVDALQLKLDVYERVKKTGMLVLELKGTTPSRLAATLSAIASTYLRQSVERRSAEAAKTLEFLETQLPIVKANLDGAEARLSSYRLNKGTVDLSRETEAMLARSAQIEQALSELELQRSELRQRYTDSHPTLLGLAEKMDRLRGERAAMAERLHGLPATELDTVRLERDVKVGTELYVLLLNKAQEFRVVKSGTVGNVRIVDQAEVPLRPSSPRPGPVTVVGLLLGLGAGVALALVRRALNEVFDEPLELERSTGLPVYAAIPHSAAEAAQRRAARRGGPRWRPLALAAPDDPAMESLRSLRSALPFALVDARSHVVAISSAAPGVGKSFVSVNLALLLASAELRVLLVDADLRGGRLHRHFGHERQPGLSDLIRGTAGLAEVVRRPEGTGLDFVACGTPPPNPAELLASPRMPKLLADLASGYDFVIVDTAPVLAVADPCLLARLAGATLLVVEATRDTLADLRNAMSRFAQSGAPVRGAILNGTTKKPSGYERYREYTLAYTAKQARP